MRKHAYLLLFLLVVGSISVFGVSPKASCEEQVVKDIAEQTALNLGDTNIDGNVNRHTWGCSECAGGYNSCMGSVDTEWNACVAQSGNGAACGIASEPKSYACANAELACCSSYVKASRCGSLSTEEPVGQGEGNAEEDCKNNKNYWINGQCLTPNQAHNYCQDIKSSRAYADASGNCQECQRGSVFNRDTTQCEADRDCSSKSNSAWNENAQRCICSEGYYESADTTCKETTRKQAGFPGLPGEFSGNLHQGESRDMTITFAPSKGTLLVRASVTEGPHVTVSVKPSTLQIAEGKRGTMKVHVTAATDLEEFTNDLTTAVLQLAGSDDSYQYSGSVPIRFRILQGEAFEPDTFEGVKVDTSTSYGVAHKKIVDYVKSKGFGKEETNRIFKAIDTLKSDDKDDLKLMILIGGVLIQKANEKNENPLPSDLDMKKISDTIVKAVEYRAEFEKAYERYKKTVKVNLG